VLDDDPHAAGQLQILREEGDPHAAGYRRWVPPALRIVFLGAEASTGAHALHRPAGRLRPAFIAVHAGTDPSALHAELIRAAPDVVVALAPQSLLPGALADVRARTLAIASPEAPAPDPAAFDRVLALPGASADGAWRTRPLPVDDALFADVRRARRPPRALFVGRSTEHREAMLLFSKHDHDVVHYAHGLAGAALASALGEADVGIALNPTEAPGMPSQALLHLAAGQLLIAERLTPPCGLEAGIDFIEIGTREELTTVLHQLRARPDAYHRVRIRGRLKADAHRASHVWPRLVEDLLRDLAVFGSPRGVRDTLTA
jgi:hypothetical protein